jgi:AcrR family transcriptional regulator
MRNPINNQMVISSQSHNGKVRLPGLRNPPVTRLRILAAAKHEFAKNGMGGARVDVIAKRAKTNKRMMYHYFGNKDDLFGITVEEAYAKFRDAEAALEIEKSEPIDALKRLVTFTWQYYIDNPEFITLVNSENLHRAKHIKSSRRMRQLSRQFVGRMHDLLARGQATGDFRPQVDAVQLIITIAAIGYHYLTNRYTGSVVYERDLMNPAAIEARLTFNLETVMRLVCTGHALARQGYAT